MKLEWTLVRVARLGSRLLCANKRPWRPNVWVGCDHISLGLCVEGRCTSLFPPESPESCHCCRCERVHGRTKEPKRQASQAFGIRPSSLKQRVSCVRISSDTTVGMQAASESWPDRVWAWLCNPPRTWEERAKVLDGCFINESQTLSVGSALLSCKLHVSET